MPTHIQKYTNAYIHMFMCVHNTSLDRTKRQDKHAEEQVPALAWMHTCNGIQTWLYATHTRTRQSSRSIHACTLTQTRTHAHCAEMRRIRWQACCSTESTRRYGHHHSASSWALSSPGSSLRSPQPLGARRRRGFSPELPRASQPGSRRFPIFFHFFCGLKSAKRRLATVPSSVI